MSDKPMSISLAARSKAWVCGGSLAGIAGSNPAGGVNVSLLRMLCVVRQMSLRRTDHSSRGVLPGGMYLGVIVKPPILRRPWPIRGYCAVKIKIS